MSIGPRLTPAELAIACGDVGDEPVAHRRKIIHVEPTHVDRLVIAERREG